MGVCGYYGTGYSGTAPTESQVGITSRLYVPAGTARPVLWFHSAGAGAVGAASLEPWLGANDTMPLLNAITSLGLPVLSADCSGSGHWGNDTAQLRATDMRAFAQSSANLMASSGKVILMGVSMGGLLALNWAISNPTLVQAIVIFYPCVNLQAQHDGTGGAAAVTTGTQDAYGGSLSTFNVAEPTHDPSYSGVPVGFQSFPIYMGYSDSDVVVGSANQTAWISAVGGSNLTTRLYAGAGHADMTKPSPSNLYSWLAPYA